jgi:predicted amidohydrolase YtcJ
MLKKLSVSALVMLLIISSMDTSAKIKVDLIVHNAVIYTVDSAFSTCNCFAVADGRFVAIGNEHDIMDRYDAREVIDAKGKFIYPGLIDAHAHYYGYALGLNYADLSKASSETQMLEILQQHARRHPSAWLVGRGWDQNRWPGKQFPDNTKLNQLFPGTPVVLTRVDGHAVLANNEAIRRAGIANPASVQSGEAILKAGRFSGIFLENTADKLRQAIPAPKGEELDHLLAQAEANCFRVGLTTVADAGLDKLVIQHFDDLQRTGKMKLRIYAMLNPSAENLNYFLKNGPYITDHLTVRSVKLYADGALGSRGACLLQPYDDSPANRGMIVTSPDILLKVCHLAFDHGFQVNTHAIGDSAVRMILHLYAGILKGKNDRRWRIEHAQVVAGEDLHLFGDNNIIPSVQATHATSDMYWAGERLGKDRIKTAYAYKALKDQNGWIPNGTDFPIEHINPLLTFYAAVFRTDSLGYPEGGFQPENALSREEALRSITIWPARAAFEENIKGSIEKGKWADFILVDTDLMKAPAGNILKAEVEASFSGGNRVFTR